jgi:N-terminal domain of anti-restriction factor ArdC
VDRASQRDGEQLLRLCRRSRFRTVLSQFLKFCSYFPFNAKLCLNGHEYAKRQLAQKGIAFEALDNGILTCADPKRLQAICDGLSAAKIDALLRKWLRLLPYPFTGADRTAGYRYDFSILQTEFSTTQVLDRPVHGRLFFEQVIRENLDLGRPDQIELIFNRRIPRNARARFRTRVVTQDVTPSLNVYYKNARIKQYHKENRALRTETTINNTYDFGMKRDLYAEVSARIVAELETGAAPWIKPWSATPGANTPCNAVTNRPDSGCNVVLLWMAQAAGYKTPRFLTFKQALEAGGRVRKGERGTKVYFVKQLEIRERRG